MIKPPIPVDELLRLETLRNLKILDTDPEERFDRVTRLAKRIFGTPIALVSLVDGDRQWFKSRLGLDATETPRDISFCGHAILNDEVLVVNDAHDDERFNDNPLVTGDPNIRFYAGCPLSAPDGQKVGTLCIIDREPRTLAEEDLAMLAELGRMVEEEFVVENLLRDDPVTGLSNRNGFALIAQHLLAMCVRNSSPASLVLFYFKNQPIIDGSMGTEASDRAAIELTQLLLASFRDSDIVGRLSADTFAVLLANSKLDHVDTARQRLLQRVAEQNSASRSNYEIELESHAIAYDPDRHSDVESLLQDAEGSLTNVGASALVDRSDYAVQDKSA